MEPLVNQLRSLPGRTGGISNMLKVLLGVALVAAIAFAAWMSGGGEGYQYAFTNLSPEDGTEAAATLKAAGVPFRLDANGAALAVPANKVYDARLLLASAGLPRGGGVGFELFDRGDLGVSEFTQKVNLRRAIEGELSRTVGRLSEVRSARVHVTLAEKGLYRDEDRKGSASVVVALQAGRTLGEKQLAGIRHLVASAVPGLSPDVVTVMDARGTVLSGEGANESAGDYQRRMERELEARIVGLLEPVVGTGSAIARVAASLDMSQVDSTAETFDPDATAVRSERTSNNNSTQETGGANGGIAGAAANQPLQGVQAGQSGSGGNRNQSGAQEEVRNFEISKAVTRTVNHLPRLQRLSVALLLGNPEGGTPRTEEEIARLTELAKRAVGFDESRGDRIDVSTAAFTRKQEGTQADAPVPTVAGIPKTYIYGGAGGLLLLLIVIGAMAMRGSKQGGGQAQPLVLRPGARVSELEAGTYGGAGYVTPAGGIAGATGGGRQLPDPETPMRERARALVSADPTRAAHLIRSWISQDGDSKEAGRG